jgi:hypothetical protein
MKRFIVMVLILFSMVFLSNQLMAADETLKVGTGGPKGNYFAMGNDISHYCGNALQENKLEVLSSDGSVDNLLGMANKKFSIGIVQEDVLQYYAKQNPTKINSNRQKIIAGLHIETAHLLIPKDYQPENDSSGLFSKILSKFKSDDTAPLSLETLRNQTIGSWGGSIISAKALSFFMDLNLNVVEIPEDKRSTVNIPIFLVGGQPYKPVEDYLATGNFVLVSIDYNQLASRAPFYIKMDANYRIGGQIKSVPTFGVRAFMLGVSFRNESRNADMEKLSQCINEHLGDMADDPDTNPNWGVVYDLEKNGSQTNWTYFKLK